MQALQPNSQQFQPDQQFTRLVEFFDTPFTVLDVATVLLNGGLDVDASGWSAPFGKQSTGVVARTTALSFEGSAAYRVQSDVATAGTAYVRYTLGAEERGWLRTNTTYRITCWVQTDSPTYETFGLQVTTDWAGSTSRLVQSAAAAPLSTWRQVVLEWTTPSTGTPGTVTVELTASGNATGNVYVDSLTMIAPLASNGLRLDVVEPGTTAWNSWLATLQTTASNASALTAFLTGTTARVTDGRTDTVTVFWGSGAPGWHGVTTAGQVGYHWRGTLRPRQGRSWWSELTTPSAYFAVAGNGWLRIEVTSAGTTTQVYPTTGTGFGRVSEADFLQNGFDFTNTLTLASDAQVDIYYVQNDQAWGGCVVKAVAGTRTAGATATARAADQGVSREAPVVSCGLFDVGQPVPRRLHSVVETMIRKQDKQPTRAEIRVPLFNAQASDLVGYEWRRDSTTDPGYVRAWPDGVLANTYDIRRQRLVRIQHGFAPTELYTRFTGVLEDFTKDDDLVVLTCSSFEQRLNEKIDRNYPDQISYMTWGYRRTSGTVEPVYGVAAYDNWPIEYMAADVALRGGIDQSRLLQPLLVAQSTGVSVPTGFRKWRARSALGTLLRLERAVHYGNTSSVFNEVKPTDSEYLFPPQPTQDLWSKLQEVSDRYGYDIHFDEWGAGVLASRNNASRVFNFVVGDGGTNPSATTNPSTFGGQYVAYSGTQSASVSKTVEGARIDLCLPVGPTFGAWSYTVQNVAQTVTYASGTVTPTAATNSFYYNFRYRPDGTNPTVVTLYTGDYATYLVTLTPNGVATSPRALDAVFTYHVDPDATKLPQPLATNANVETLQVIGTAEEHRNHVIVVGRRKAAVTDSTKFENNPQNPAGEFVVQSAVDVASITNPAASNYVGGLREALIINTDITDDDFAAYVANTFIYRYRQPQPSAQLSHTLLPIVQFRDPITVLDARYGQLTTSQVQRVVGWAETVGLEKAITDLQTVPYPEFPSYEPREDVDIDALFQSQPVVNMQVSYTGLNNTAKTNLAATPSTVVRISPDSFATGKAGDLRQATVNVTAGTPPYLDMSAFDWPPIPGTVQVRAVATNTGGTLQEFSPYTGLGGLGESDARDRQVTAVQLKQSWRVTQVRVQYQTGGAIVLAPGPLNGTVPSATDFFYHTYDQRAGVVFLWTRSVVGLPPVRLVIDYQLAADVPTDEWLTNTPYRHLFNVDYRTGANARIYLPWVQGDESTTYQRPTQTSYVVRWRTLNAGGEYLTGSPFYDPYTSELGQLVTIRGDFLVTGFYRASVRSLHDDTVVAWLTEPTADPEQADAHWQYITAGSREFRWDGVDQVGQWNVQQSEAYAASAYGVFEQEQRPRIGRGFYCWNREQLPSGSAPPLALIATDLVAATGRPVFGHGTWAAWYVLIEAMNDRLAEATELNTTLAYPRRTDSRALVSALNGGSTSAAIYTHLPEPTKVALDVDDWAGTQTSVFDFNNQSAINTPGNWLDPNDPANFANANVASAIVHNGKPVRIRFSVQARPGTLWTGRQQQVAVRLTRHVHLKAQIYDQLVLFEGVAWPGTAVEKKRVLNRRLHDDTHTWTFTDSDFRLASTLKTQDNQPGLEWLFVPQQLRKNFTGAGEEPLQFGNYLQLQELPYWDATRGIATKRSRYQIGFVNYLFYLSAYTQDRSGRFVWCINDRFLDKSKVLTNAYGDWWDPASPTAAATQTTYRAEWPEDLQTMQRRTIVCRQWQDEPSWRTTEATRWGFAQTNTDLGWNLLRFRWEDVSPASTTLNGNLWTSYTGVTADPWSTYHVGATSTRGRLPAGYAPNRQLGAAAGAGALGATWTWETGPVWIPALHRDFHPHYLVPSMCTPLDGGESITRDFLYLSNDSILRRPSTTAVWGDVAAADNWGAVTYDVTEAIAGDRQFWVGEVFKGDGSNVRTTSLEYQRQTELVHFEDLRGIFTRGPEPAEPPVKVTPTLPYYVNYYDYSNYGITVRAGLGEERGTRVRNRIEPTYNYDARTTGTGWFRVAFRSEYVWESATMFPTGPYGGLFDAAYNVRLTRFPVAATYQVDSGAWTGWKDDIPNTGEGDTEYRLGRTGQTFTYRDVFGQGVGNITWAPVAVGPRLPGITKDTLWSMVLVGSRRTSPV